MYYRCELLINGMTYRVPDDLENWDEVKASFKRNDYAGVIRTFSNKFSFAPIQYASVLSPFQKLPKLPMLQCLSLIHI